PVKEPKRDVKKPRGTSGSTRSDPKPTPAKDPPPVKEPSGGGGCDEVSCVLNNYEGSCCAKYRKGGSRPPSGGTAPSGGTKSDMPESLDRSMISEGVAKVKGRIQACGDKSSAKGTVNVSVKVGAGGGVTSVTVNSAPDTTLGNCVQSAMQKASFKKTQNGGSFRYPAVF
ncbi:MAG: hypothetical protein WKG01_36990, partial [Kofleriaceae bacterium]